MQLNLWEGCVAMPATAQIFWDIFEATGSIVAYLLYKRFTIH